MSYKPIPGEIWLQFFELLDMKDMYKCMSVCKAWVKPAAQVFYEDLILTLSLIKSLKACIALENSNQKYNSQLLDNLQYVKKLRLKNEEVLFLLDSTFQSSILYCPFLKI